MVFHQNIVEQTLYFNRVIGKINTLRKRSKAEDNMRPWQQTAWCLTHAILWPISNDTFETGNVYLPERKRKVKQQKTKHQYNDNKYNNDKREDDELMMVTMNLWKTLNILPCQQTYQTFINTCILGTHDYVYMIVST